MAWVSEISIDLAVLRLFRQRNGFRCGSRCLYSELERRWRATGLRRTDLRCAIQRLETCACVRVHDMVPGPDVELLLGGYRRLIPVFMSAGEWKQALHALLHLWRARLRERSPPHGPGGEPTGRWHRKIDEDQGGRDQTRSMSRRTGDS